MHSIHIRINRRYYYSLAVQRYNFFATIVSQNHNRLREANMPTKELTAVVESRNCELIDISSYIETILIDRDTAG